MNINKEKYYTYYRVRFTYKRAREGEREIVELTKREKNDDEVWETKERFVDTSQAGARPYCVDSKKRDTKKKEIWKLL